MVIGQNQKQNIDDDMAITKAAAWAWYERGSWFEHKSIREIDCRRKSDDYTRKPSRYKLEAMKTPENDADHHHDSQHCVNSSSLLCKGSVEKENSLLDMYEIERISREFDCYVEGNTNTGGKHRRKSVDGGGYGGRRVVSLSEGFTKSKREKEKRKGFWSFLIGRPLVCGSNRDDVVNSNLLLRGSSSVDFRRPIIHGVFK